MRIIIAAAILLTSCSRVEEKPVVIPISCIWGYGAAGAKSATDLDPEVLKELQKYPPSPTPRGQAIVLSETLQDRSLVYQLRQSIGTLRQSGLGFAVSGTGEEALRNAISTPLATPSNTIPAGEVTLVFYALEVPGSIRILRAARLGNHVEIAYRQELSDVFVSSNVFALIPLGKLPPGEYRVSITSEKHVRLADQRVCRPFLFTVN